MPPLKIYAMLILDDLRDEKIWASWRKDGGTKVPCNYAGISISSTCPDSWVTRDEAARRRPEYFEALSLGLYETAEGWLWGIDLDSCRNKDSGAIETWALEVIERMSSYSEISPSETGIKILALLSHEDRELLLPLFDRGGGEQGKSFKRGNGKDHPPAIEIYIGKRFFAVTGRTILRYESLTRVAAGDIKWLIDFGEAFAPPPKINGNGAGPRDNSRSAKAYRATGDFLRNHDDPDIRAWAAEKGDNRQINRIVDRQPRKTEQPLQQAAVLTCAGNLKMEPIQWAWKHWLAKGKFHILAGAPEGGKTTLGLSLIAIISSGERWPDGTRATQQHCLLWTSEDGVSDTIIPRLTQMSADLSRVHIVAKQRIWDGREWKERPFNPASDMPELIGAANSLEGGAGFLMIDPIVAAIGVKTNSHTNSETRIALQPVVDFAEKANCAVLGITHMTKGTIGKDPIERITGSLAFGALPRIVFVAAKNQADNGGEAPNRLYAPL
jgi:hypothetical protein